MRHLIKMRRQEGGDAGVRYAATADAGAGPLIKSVEIRASALPDPPPESISLTIEWAQQQPAGRAPAGPGEPRLEVAAMTSTRRIETGRGVTWFSFAELERTD